MCFIRLSCVEIPPSRLQLALIVDGVHIQVNVQSGHTILQYSFISNAFRYIYVVSNIDESLVAPNFFYLGRVPDGSQTQADEFQDDSLAPPASECRNPKDTKWILSAF